MEISFVKQFKLSIIPIRFTIKVSNHIGKPLSNGTFKLGITEERIQLINPMIMHKRDNILQIFNKDLG
jgi:hypothetical protein